MSKITDEGLNTIKNQIRYYIVSQGGKWVSDSELGLILGHDREFVGKLRQEIRDEFIEGMKKESAIEELGYIRNTCIVARQELWRIVMQEKDATGNPVSARVKVSALDKIMRFTEMLFELYQSAGIYPYNLGELTIKAGGDQQIVDILELLKSIVDVLDEDPKQKVLKVIGEYAKNLTNQTTARS